MSLHVLIVDDSPSILQMVRFTLEGEAYTVTEAEDGLLGLERIQEHASPFDLIITDLNMPNMDGLAFIRAVREREDYRFTPILFLTTEGATDRKQQARQAGATGWIVKPFEPERLLGVIRKVT
jgi:two-component system chemotaxis response regulator CheY